MPNNIPSSWIRWTKERKEQEKKKKEEINRGTKLRFIEDQGRWFFFTELLNFCSEMENITYPRNESVLCQLNSSPGFLPKYIVLFFTR